MQLSVSNHYQRADLAQGFTPASVDGVNELLFAARFDWSPGIYRDGWKRDKDWISSDWLFFDVDNEAGPHCSIKEFSELFARFKFFIITSRNHQKAKSKTNKKTGIVTDYPPSDRFHVLFPVETITDITVLNKCLSTIIGKYPFFDKNAKGANRFFYGFDNAEVFFHDGIRMNPPRSEKVTATSPDMEAVLELSKHADETKDSAQERIIDHVAYMVGLRLARDNGAFVDRDKWVKLGYILYANEFTYEDWMELSDKGEDTPANLARWRGFATEHNTGTMASLTYTIREYADPTFMTRGLPASTPLKDAIIEAKAAQIAQEFALAIAPEHGVYKLMGPTTLEGVPSNTLTDTIRAAITFLDKDGTLKYRGDWYDAVFRLDPQIQNCRFNDYTMGIPRIAYSNTSLLKSALYQRLKHYVPVGMARNETIREWMVEQAEYRNREYAGVIAFVDHLRELHPEPDPDALDKLMGFITFGNPPGYTKEQARKMYKEFFHLFFLRMHLHVDGVRIKEGGGYKFLMENDLVPVLQGVENLGKTTFCKYLACSHLAQDMYAELGSGAKSDKFGDMGTIRAVRGRLIAEIGEMKALKKPEDVETVKSFISKTMYDMDVKYVEYTSPLPVTVSYIGTANLHQWAAGTSGNRRFVQVLIEAMNQDAMAENPGLIEELHALYATLAASIPVPMRLGACRPTPALKAFMSIGQEDSLIKHSDYEVVSQVVHDDFNAMLKSHKPNAKFHTITQLMIVNMARGSGYMERITKDMTALAMKALGYEESDIRVNGTKTRGWKRLYAQAFVTDDIEKSYDEVNVDG